MPTKKAAPVEEVAKVVEPVKKVTPFDEFMEHQKTSMSEFGKAVETLIPQGVRDHGEAAVRESVEGYRKFFNATLDNLIERIERAKLTDEEPLSEKVDKAVRIVRETVKDVVPSLKKEEPVV
ncbi:MAG: hypothetical protein L6Q98_16595 [Anaerolineae bacterium]|nr:hypothetical protein [Anaerolineae bacterium]NUQ05145.1 hypothetical protein [Anaerolineae bacterium]